MAVDNPPPLEVRKISFSQLVRQADPSWQRDFSWSVEMEFSNGRKFYGNPQQRGRYSPDFVDHVDTIDGQPAPSKGP